MSYKIEKNTVQETLIIPLYARKICSELYPSLYRDETAIRLVSEADYDFSALDKKSRTLMQRFGSLEVAMRQNDLAFEVRDYLKSHPTAAVVNLGCGLDNTGRNCDNSSCKIYNLDLPDVIKVRSELLPAGKVEKVEELLQAKPEKAKLAFVGDGINERKISPATSTIRRGLMKSTHPAARYSSHPACSTIFSRSRYRP